jgi:hypothetical protein
VRPCLASSLARAGQRIDCADTDPRLYVDGVLSCTEVIESTNAWQGKLLKSLLKPRTRSGAAVAARGGLKTPVEIKYATTRVTQRCASKARRERIPLSIQPSGMAELPNDCPEQSWPTDEQHSWRRCCGARVRRLF